MTVSGPRGTRLAVASLGVAVALVAAAITVFACTPTAQISLGTDTAQPGSTVSGSGTAFNPTGSAVAVHFNSPSGPVLWSGNPASNGTIAFTFTVPQVAPGYYVIAATQTDASGNPVLGSPARAPLQVPAPPSQPSPASSDNAPAQQQSQSTSAGAGAAAASGATRSTSGVAATTGQPAAAAQALAPVAVPATSAPREPAPGSLRGEGGVNSESAAPSPLPSLRHEVAAGAPVLPIALVAGALLLAVVIIGLLRRRRFDIPGARVLRSPAQPSPTPSDAGAFVTWAEDVVTRAAEGSSEDQIHETEAAPAVTRP